ncbi:MAG: hypothetical protein GX650_01405 [Clostridiales bacterium]|nr:hypothetical protein [Clostridiales bacterium]
MSLLLIEERDNMREIALLEAGELVAYWPPEPAGTIQPEQIYLGRVGRIMKSLQAAFVRIAPHAEGFLPIGELKRSAQVRQGDTVVVQVRKPPLGGKSAFLTADIALTGAYVLLLPVGTGCRVSKRVSESSKQTLLDIAQQVCPEGMGIVMRERCLNASAEDVEAEVQLLLERWQSIEKKAKMRSAPALLEGAEDRLAQVLREERTLPERIITNVPLQEEIPGVPVTIAASPMQLHQVHRRYQKALRRKVLLKSGATLVIDPCEAMTVIDVNTAHRSGGRDREKELLHTNLEAAREIARLLRLRRMGGIILIDFIDMESGADRQQVQEAMQDMLRQDPVKCSIHGFTSLGLMELTRKRSGDHAEAERLQTCPRCGGKGFLSGEENDHA